jgi:N utilization substance protein B
MMMSTARDLRRCALQALYQFDAGNVDRPEWVRESLEGSAGSEQTHQAGFDLALGAWEMREQADAVLTALTPDWPTYRQPVIDRSILRMAYYEIVAEAAPPKVVINEAVELAKEFSTEKSPLFINGVLDKFYRMRGESSETADEPNDHDAADALRPNDEATCSR